MDFEERILARERKLLSKKLKPVKVGLKELVENKETINLMVFHDIYDQGLLKWVIDTCDPLIRDSKWPSGESVFSILLAGRSPGAYDGMFGRLWNIYVKEPEVSMPDLRLPGSANHFLCECIAKQLGLPEGFRIVLDDVWGLSNKEIAEKISWELYYNSKGVLIGSDPIDLVDIWENLKKRIAKSKQDHRVISFLAESERE